MLFKVSIIFSSFFFAFSNCYASNIEKCIAGETQFCQSAASSLIESSPHKALFLWEKGCEGRDGECCGNAGYIYEKGISVRKSPKIALSLYKKGCSFQNGYACYNLARAYMLGLGTPTSIQNAKKFLQISCKLKYQESCEALKILFNE